MDPTSTPGAAGRRSQNGRPRPPRSPVVRCQSGDALARWAARCGRAGGLLPGRVGVSTRSPYTCRHEACNLLVVADRINVTLDAEYASKLSRLAERMHVQEGTLAKSLLS